MKSLLFHKPEAWKRYLFRAEPSRIGPYRASNGVPPGIVPQISSDMSIPGSETQHTDPFSSESKSGHHCFQSSWWAKLSYSRRFVLNSALSHWLLRGHMTSNNETDSCQTLWAGNIANNVWRQKVTMQCYPRMLTDDRRYSEVNEFPST